MTHDGDLYDAAHIAFLERLWGAGYMSPGGADEVARVLAGLDLAGRTVVDIGCGAGGITVALARDFGAGRVVGLDVEGPVCTAARARAEAAGLGHRVEIVQVAPGRMPLPDASADVVFSKDSIVHIDDKEALARDVFRVLKPGGWFAASDWLIGHDGPPSPEMEAYLKSENLDFGMASAARYQAALQAAGFEAIHLTDRNPWYREQAREELARLEGTERPAFEAILGSGEIARQIRTWRAMIVVLDKGEHCPHHLRARKPL